MRNVECGMWNVECGMWNVECGSWKLEVGSWKLEVGRVRGLDLVLSTVYPVRAFPIPHSTFHIAPTTTLVVISHS